MKKTLLSTICMMLLLVLCTGSLSAQTERFNPNPAKVQQEMPVLNQEMSSFNQEMPSLNTNAVSAGFATFRGGGDPAMIHVSGGAALKGTVSNPYGSQVGTTPNIQATEYVDGEIYGNVWSGGNRFGKVNVNTGAWTLIKSYPCDAASMSYNPVDGKLYCFPWTGDDSDGPVFGTVDPATGDFTTLATFPINSPNTYYAAIDVDGVCYGVNNATSDFGTINLTNCTFTKIGTVPFQISYIQDMSFDRETGELYWLAQQYLGQSSTYYKIDKTTGALTTVLPANSSIANCFTIMNWYGGPHQDCDPATITEVKIEGACNKIEWTLPAKKGEVILTQGGNFNNMGIGAGQASFGAYHRFTPAELTAVANGQLKEVIYAPMYGQGQTGPGHNYNIRIYQGGSWSETPGAGRNPGTLVHEQAVPLADIPFDGNEYTVTLTSPISIDATKELWIGYENINIPDALTQKSPAGIDAGPRKDHFGNLMFFSSAWTTLWDAGGPNNLNYNWTIKGVVETEPGVTVNLYYNDKLLVSNLEGTSYLHCDHSGIEHCYTVEVKCVDGSVSEMSNEKCVSTTPPCNPATNLTVTFAENCTSADLAWTQPAPDQLYNIYRDGAMVKEKHNATTYTDTDLNPGEEYTWSVTVVCGAVESDPITKTSKCEGINDIGLSRFTIAPNPATNEVVIKAGVEFNTVEVVNFLGQTVISQVVNNNSVKLDVSNLNNGVYFVRLVSENGTSVKKFVKQ